MSIKILPQSEIKSNAASFQTPAILFASPKNLYQRRAKRLRELAQHSPFGEYLQFVAHIVDAQLATLESQPLNKQDLSFNEEFPLRATQWSRHAIWQDYLSEILAFVKPHANVQTSATIERLEKMAKSELEHLASQLLAQDFHLVASDVSLFIWAALSLYWTQLTQQIPHNSRLENAENLHICPVCASHPVASVVHFGQAQGLRYLHCALCESEWNVVRAQCTNCNNQGNVELYSLDDTLASVRAEACADDLASLFLDVELEEKGLARSGINPLMFPAQ